MPKAMPGHMPAQTHAPQPGAHPPRGGPVRRAAQPLAWWAVLLALYLGLVSSISLTEITVGALAAAAGAAAAVAAARVLFVPAAGEPVRWPVPPARPAPALAWLPARIAADTARVIVRGAAGGTWTPLAVAPGPAGRGTATLLMSVSPGTYVGGVDPERGLVRVHRLTPRPSPFERRLRTAGLVAAPGPDAGEGGEGGEAP